MFINFIHRDNSMTNNVIDFSAHFKKRAEKKATPQTSQPMMSMDDMREPVQNIETLPVAFEPEEMKALLNVYTRAVPAGYLRDYAMPLTADARPLFSFKTRVEDPDYINIEKASIEDDKIIFIVRKLGETPSIAHDFDGALDMIQSEIFKMQKKAILEVVPDSPAHNALDHNDL